MRQLSYKEIQNKVSDPESRIHFIGIGGVSMYSLARLTLSGGVTVSGSDRVENKRTRDLCLMGAEIESFHSANNIKGADLVVFSHAISPDNEELTLALERGIPTISRDRFLGALMMKYSTRIGVSGSHGKSSTVAILDAIFCRAMTNPTVLSGSDLPTGSPIRIGSNRTMIYEACEYKDSFLSFSPSIAVALNLELDHTDCFKDIDALKSSFTKALGRAERFALINGDDENLLSIKDDISSSVITFGSGSSNDYSYSFTSFFDGGFEFSLSKYGSIIGNFRLNIPGAFNINNASAAIICALEYGIDMEIIKEAIESYRGIPRRLEYIGQRFGRSVYYDYAHHPTEIRASINALKIHQKTPITVIFKPHTYSRTQALWEDFCSSLSLADHLILLDIYPAREDAVSGITSERLAEDIGKRAVYRQDDDVLTYLDLYTKGSIALMGAGDLEKIKECVIFE